MIDKISKARRIPSISSAIPKSKLCKSKSIKNTNVHGIKESLDTFKDSNLANGLILTKSKRKKKKQTKSTLFSTLNSIPENSISLVAAPVAKVNCSQRPTLNAKYRLIKTNIKQSKSISSVGNDIISIKKKWSNHTTLASNLTSIQCKPQDKCPHYLVPKSHSDSLNSNDLNCK